MSSPQALREALCTKIFCSVKSNAKNQHYVCWCGYHKEPLEKKGPCKVQKFQNRVWALISRGKSPIYFEVLLLLRFANHP